MFESYLKSNEKEDVYKFSYGEEFKNSMHVSECGGGVSPYALALNELIHRQLESRLNNL